MRNIIREIETAIADAAYNMRLELDDNWSDAMDREVMAIADEFGLDDTDWIEEQIKLSLMA